MSKIQVKPAQESVEKIKKVVDPKVVAARKPSKVKKVKAKGETVAAAIKVTGVKPSDVSKLGKRATKYLSSWYSKAGSNGPELLKLIAKHSRDLAKAKK